VIVWLSMSRFVVVFIYVCPCCICLLEFSLVWEYVIEVSAIFSTYVWVLRPVGCYNRLVRFIALCNVD
jgi:hypothetical protein